MGIMMTMICDDDDDKWVSDDDYDDCYGNHDDDNYMWESEDDDLWSFLGQTDYSFRDKTKEVDYSRRWESSCWWHWSDGYYDDNDVDDNDYNDDDFS